MNTQVAVVIPAAGIGDALLMMIASHRLMEAGYQTTTCHSSLIELAPFFPGHEFYSHRFISQLMPLLESASLILLENDNSQNAKDLIAMRTKGILKQLSVFYPSYSSTKHAPLHPLDQVFHPQKSMAENISKAISHLVDSSILSKDNGIKIPSSYTHRLYQKRVLIHPTSSSSKKNWTASNYLRVGEQLSEKGFFPAFIISKEERKDWEHAIRQGFHFPLFPTLRELVPYVYESGYMIGNDSLLGHLASNLNIPTLILSDDEMRMQLWKPGWLPGKVLTPSRQIPNFKPLRLREKHWKKWISIKRVLSSFDELLSTF